jgi:hypothetical protein
MGFAHDVRINIFNISKINSEVRGGKEPRIKRMREVLGDSYFNHLASLDGPGAVDGRVAPLPALAGHAVDQRAEAPVRPGGDGHPFVESTRGPVPFKNVVMDYPLARAMEDGFVKEPAAVTQRNFRRQGALAPRRDREDQAGRWRSPSREHQGRAADLCPRERREGGQALHARDRAGHHACLAAEDAD